MSDILHRLEQAIDSLAAIGRYPHADRRSTSLLLALVIAILWEVAVMASIVVRGLDEAVKARLAARAKEHGRSMEAEVRDILTREVTRPNIGLALLAAARTVDNCDELPIPDRLDPARAADLR